MAGTGQSTVNPSVPIQGSPLQSPPIRANFAAAQADINNAFTMFSGATAPTAPVLGVRWLDTSVTPNIIRIYDGTQWVPWEFLDTVGHTITPVAGGNSAPEQSANFTLSGNYKFWPLNLASAILVTLPTTFMSDHEFILKDVSLSASPSNALTCSPSVDGLSTLISSPGGFVRLYWSVEMASWYIVG